MGATVSNFCHKNSHKRNEDFFKRRQRVSVYRIDDGKKKKWQKNLLYFIWFYEDRLRQVSGTYFGLFTWKKRQQVKMKSW